MTDSLPSLDTSGLTTLGIALPALAAIRVALTGGRGAKFHVPVSDLRRGYGDCRYAKPSTDAATFALLEVFGDVCKKCAIVLPDPADALWRAAAFATRRAAALERARNDTAVRTWLGYARLTARHQTGDDEQFAAWLTRARTDRKLARDARTLAAVWKCLAADTTGFLEEYAAGCPAVDAFNGARDAVRRSQGSPERHALDQVSAAVARTSRTRTRMFGPDPDLDVWQVVSGVWLASRSQGASAGRGAELVRAAAARELDGVPVVDVTRLPPPSTGGGAHASPAAWADHEFALWWPRAVAEACRRLEEEFEAESAQAPTRLLLVHDWPLTGARDAPVAYLAASPVVGPVVPHGYRRVDDYVSWSGGDSAGPSYSAVIAAPGHLVAKLEKEQAAVRDTPPRFVAAGRSTGRRADLEAAKRLLRTAFPFLPGDGDGEPAVPSPQVQEQRRARAAGHRIHLIAGDERPYRVASALTDGYGSWIPEGSGDLELLEELLPWVHRRVLRLDAWCGPAGGEKVWASLFGTLDTIEGTGLGFSPAGRHRPVRVPLHRVVALTGAPRWDDQHPYRTASLWEPYEALPPLQETAARERGRIRAVPSSGDSR
ncbi:hypothetical protein [Streptomyces yaizuensis]|uniref:Uncharacterized protein n=1 Tax=Streptomyces yaizuensis TaxID=2989713 RepID=A0ABQ5P7H8_9ACTN|nr:hypothetical protein [Streptomyces sp. YSPA8]GLF98181.1 hypothetical protein SYYSPA8_27810 [Streptomyces sp. YSPA8]